jgi:TetR/AcrR family transcriptional regulator
VWNPVEASAAPEELIRGIVERMLTGIDQMPWIPSTWMREILNEGGLLRSRLVHHLPFDKVKSLGEAIACGQVVQAINPDIDAELMVYSIIGLVMLHMATVCFWAEIFKRTTPDRQTLCHHITGLLLHGLQREAPALTGKRIEKK